MLLALHAIFLVVVLRAIFLLLALHAIFLVVVLRAIFLLLVLHAIFLVVVLRAIFLLLALHAIFLVVVLRAIFLLLALHAIFLVVVLRAIFLLLALHAIFLVVVLRAIFLLIAMMLLIFVIVVSRSLSNNILSLRCNLGATIFPTTLREHVQNMWTSIRCIIADSRINFFRTELVVVLTSSSESSLIVCVFEIRQIWIRVKFAVVVWEKLDDLAQTCDLRRLRRHKGVE
jgi:hypothetical protein